VVRLANRRFVPFYFDLSTRGAAGDADARTFVVAARKELGGGGVPTPPVLFMNAKGEVLGEVSNYATEAQVLAAMLKVLKDYKQFNEATEAEQAVKTVVDRAQILIDLQQLDEAKKLLATEDSDPAHYLLGRLARREGAWDEMEKQFKQVKDKAFADDLRMEQAYRYWADKDYGKLRDHLKEFPKGSKRFTEARYYEGLAFHHLRDEKKALEIWRDTIKGCDQDPWNYRADWAYSNVKEGDRKSFSTTDPKTSLLDRIGYIGRRNPDLAKPK